MNRIFCLMGKLKLRCVLASALLITACASEPTPPPVDVIGTMAAQMASEMLTQTVAAYSPTPPPSTATPVPTDTPVSEPTKDASIRIVTIRGQQPCWFGPGESYGLESYISDTKKVELLGIGSVDGWYVIMNPYFHQPCWVAADAVELDPAMDISVFPTITP